MIIVGGFQQIFCFQFFVYDVVFFINVRVDLEILILYFFVLVFCKVDLEDFVCSYVLKQEGLDYFCIMLFGIEMINCDKIYLLFQCFEIGLRGIFYFFIVVILNYR